MHALTTEEKSTPATILARVGAARGEREAEGRKQKATGIQPLSHRAFEPLKDSVSSNHSITQSPNHSISSPPPRFIVTLDAPMGAGDPLTRIPLAVTGKWVRDGSDFSVTLGDLEEIVQNFKKRRNGEINVDYDHASEMPEVGAGGPVPSAGRIVKLDGPEEIRSQESGVRMARHSSLVTRHLSRATNIRPRTKDKGLMTKDAVSSYGAGTNPRRARGS